jgi:hypothetical protein
MGTGSPIWDRIVCHTDPCARKLALRVSAAGGGYDSKQLTFPQMMRNRSISMALV